MTRLAIAASIIAASISKAFAAELPTKLQTKAPLVTPSFSWTGFYIGGSGQGMLSTDASALDVLTGLPFHGGMAKWDRGFFGTASADKRLYRRRADQTGFRKFPDHGSEQPGSTETERAIVILSSGRRSDRLAA